MMKKYKLMTILMIALFCTQVALAQVNPEERRKVRAEKMRIIEEMNKPADTKGVEEKQHYIEEQQKKQQSESTEGKTLQRNEKPTEDAKQQKTTVVEKLNPNLGEENTPELNSSSTEKGKAIEENKQKFETAPKEKQLEMLYTQLESAEGMSDEQKLAIKIQMAELQGQDVSEMKTLQNTMRSKQPEQTTTDIPTKQVTVKEQSGLVRTQNTQANGIGEGLVPALKGMSGTQKLEYLFKDTQFKKEVISNPQWDSLSETDKVIFAEKMYLIKNQ